MRSLPTAVSLVVPALLALFSHPLLGLQTNALSPSATDWERAVAAIQDGRFEEAAAAARLVVGNHPEHAGSHFLLGSALLQLGRVTEALPSLEEAYRLAPGDTGHALALAAARLKSKRGAAAVEPLAAVLQQLETGNEALAVDQRAFFARLLARAALDSPDDAAGLLERAVARLPEETVLWLALAEAHRRDGQPQSAYATLLRAQHGDPGDRRAGEMALQLARSQAAEQIDADARLAWWRRAAEAADLLVDGASDAPTLRVSADSWLAAGEPTLAAARLQAAAEITGEDADLLYQLARCALATDDTTAAERYLLAALEKQTGDELAPRIQRALATLYHRRGAYERAAEAYRLAGMTHEADALAELAATRRECVDLRARLRGLLAASEAPAGSPARRAIEAELAATNVTCADVLAALP